MALPRLLFSWRVTAGRATLATMTRAQAEEVAKGETASTSTNPSTPADFFKDGMKNFSEIILQLINYFLEFIGAKKPDMMQELVKEWKNTIAQDELKMLKEMYGSGRNFFKKMDNIHKLIKDQDETRRVFAARKADTLPNETWNQWMQRHLSEQEQEEINTSTTIEPKKIADYLISSNTEEDKPAAIINAPETTAKQQPPPGPSGPTSK
jgi:hypothetical protein